jgi:formylglycine-generating enzyme required for sulfatase activity
MPQSAAPVPTVFFSSTSEDLAEYREAARDAALQAGFYPSMMEYFTASGARPPLAACLEKIDAADLVVSIVAYRYGWIPPGQPEGETKSVTWLECEHAVDAGKEVIPLLVEPGANWPHDRREEFRMMEALQQGTSTPELLAEIQHSVQRLGDFKAWLNGRGIRAVFRTPDDLGRQVASALHDWRARNPGFGRAASTLDHRGALAAYRRELVKASRHLPLQGLDVESSDPTATNARLELAKVYVTLDTTTTVPVEAASAPTPAPRAWWRRFLDRIGVAERPSSAEPPTLQPGLERRDERRPLGALEAIALNRRVVILGGPGSGKSTLLSHFTFCLAQHQLEPQGEWLSQLEGWPGDDAAVVPIVVILRDFARSLGAQPARDADQARLLSDFIRSRLEQQNLGGAAVPLEQALDQGAALVLFDGLDEIPTKAQRAAVHRTVSAFCARYDRSRYIVTCRTLSYQETDARLDGFPTFELAPFDPARIAAFIGAWYAELLRLGQVDAHLSETYANRLRDAALRPDLAQLAPNPLLLTVMALVHTHKGRLPDARAQLYEEIIDILLWRWEGRRGDDHVGLRAMLREVSRSESDLKRVLWRVAFESHRDGGSGRDGGLADISEGALLGALRTLHPSQSLDWSEQLVELMKLRAGLLLERVPGTFTFPHRTFQEYLAGAHLTVQERFVEQTRALAREPAFWRQAILLAAGRLVHVTGAIERPLTLASELCPASFDPAAADDGACRRAWLAGEILDEVGIDRTGGLEIGRELARRVPVVLARLLERGVLTSVERAALGTTLGRVGDPRFDPARWFLPVEDEAPLGFLKVEAGPFLMGSDPKRDRYAQEDEQLQHPVDLAEFFVARYPVTVAQFAAFARDSGYQPGDGDSPLGTANHPVAWVSWKETLAYCRWLTERLRAWEGAPRPIDRWLAATVRNGWHVTLPSEAEWEKAARGTDGRIYPWRDAFSADMGNFGETGIGRTSAVGAFPGGRSPSGALDMSGNVWEWTRSLWGPDWQKPQFAYPYRPEDPRREDLTASDSIVRVVRGGSFLGSVRFARAACRNWDVSDDRDDDVGFRVVVSCSGS